jgi:hypothetical protein
LTLGDVASIIIRPLASLSNNYQGRGSLDGWYN